jgi:hypothetical protein
MIAIMIAMIVFFTVLSACDEDEEEETECYIIEVEDEDHADEGT